MNSEIEKVENPQKIQEICEKKLQKTHGQLSAERNRPWEAENAGKRGQSRELKISSLAELEKKISEFIADCKERKVPMTLSRLAASLGVSRKTLREYSARELYAPSLKKIKLLIEADLEERMLTERNPIGYFRSLSSSFEGWIVDVGGESRNPATILRIEFTRAKTEARDIPHPVVEVKR